MNATVSPADVLFRILLVSIPLCIADVSLGQNPFDTGGDASADNPFGIDMPASPVPGVFGSPAPAAAADAAKASAATEEDPDPVVRVIRKRPPNTPKDMADAITWMIRIKRYDEIARLLDRIAAENWSLDAKAAMSRDGGSGLWIRLRSQSDELSESQIATIREILNAPGKLARDPAWIDSWIDRLGSKSAGERRLALLRLQDAGTHAVARLMARLVEGDTKVEPVMLAGATAQFGASGVDALRAACLLRDAARASRVLLALAEVPGNPFSAELGFGLASPDLAEDTHEQLVDKLQQRYPVLPTTAAIHEHLAKKFQNSFEAYQLSRADRSDVASQAWRPSQDGLSIESVEVTVANGELERAAQLAAMRVRVGNLSRTDLAACAAVLLQRAYQANAGLSPADLDNFMLASLATLRAENPNLLQAVFAEAGERQLHGAAIRALQLIADDPAAEQQLDFLSEQLGDPRPVVRYTSLEAIAKINPTRPFAGAETVLKTALEMSRLSAGPQSLVIGLHAVRRQAAQHQLEMQTGGSVTTVNSSRAALLALQQGQPFELIVIVDRVADQSLFELIQRLRAGDRSHSLPIAVLTDELYQHERELVERTPGVIHSVLSKNTEQMQRVLELMSGTLDTVPLTVGDRTSFALVAGDLLARISGGDTQQYAFYPIVDLRRELVDTPVLLTASKRAQLLSGLGSADSQRALVEMTTNVSLQASDRLAAANAFASSVRAFGMSLGKQDILRNYELYNKIGPTDAIAAKSLGLILDVVEAHAGLSEWPQDLAN